jgi:hypothetical protein
MLDNGGNGNNYNISIDGVDGVVRMTSVLANVELYQHAARERQLWLNPTI